MVEHLPSSSIANQPIRLSKRTNDKSFIRDTFGLQTLFTFASQYPNATVPEANLHKLLTQI